MNTLVARAFNEGDPAADERGYRRCLSEFPTGVTVVTTRVGDKLFGVTANSFSSLSLSPPLVLWAISRKSRSFSAFEGAERFVINILEAGQVGVSQTFSSRSEDKFAEVTWHEGLGGSPVLDGSIAVLECERTVSHDGGDHLLLIGIVRRFFHNLEGRPLAFSQGQYRITADHPEREAGLVGTGKQSPCGEQGTDIPLTTLLSRAHYIIEKQFEGHRQAEGVTLPENKVLIGLYGGQGQTADALARQMYFGPVELSDAIQELRKSGDVKDDDGLLSLTARGRARREAIMKRVWEKDARQLEGISPSDLQSTRRVLTRLLTGSATQIRSIA
jgi:flavin reductase (DIM6/NTAB) family NADH-FMN oxidoreductase RutF/DNA-binding MarR family transcriptional regulator